MEYQLFLLFQMHFKIINYHIVNKFNRSMVALKFKSKFYIIRISIKISKYQISNICWMEIQKLFL